MKRPTFGSKVSNYFLSNNFLTNKLLTFSLRVLNLYFDWHWLAVRMASLPLGGAGGGLEQQGTPLRLFRLFPSIKLDFSFEFTELSSPQRKYGEPSPSQRRRLVIETPSLRQLVESKGALQSIHKWASENPQKRCTKSSKSDGSDRRIK